MKLTTVRTVGLRHMIVYCNVLISHKGGLAKWSLNIFSFRHRMYSYHLCPNQPSSLCGDERLTDTM